MDDLLMFLYDRLTGDPHLAATFRAAGKDKVSVASPTQRLLAGYPRIILDGDDGQMLTFGENDPPQFLNGRVRIEIVTCYSLSCPQPLSTLRAIQANVSELILGSKGRGIEPVKGSKVSDDWTVTKLNQANPTGPLPVTQPEYERHLTTYSVQLYRISR